MADIDHVTVHSALLGLFPNARPRTVELAADRFLSSFEKKATDECWAWSATKRPTGYGLFQIGGSSALQVTHIVLVASGQKRVIGKTSALHSCDNPNCVNPSHLRWGNAKDNADDREARGRSVKPRGEAHGRAKLTENDVRFIRSCGLSLHEMKLRFGVSIRVLSLARAGKTWKHVQ